MITAKELRDLVAEYPQIETSYERGRWWLANRFTCETETIARLRYNSRERIEPALQRLTRPINEIENQLAQELAEWAHAFHVAKDRLIAATTLYSLGDEDDLDFRPSQQAKLMESAKWHHQNAIRRQQELREMLG
jgi:hypothetical protein